MLQAINPGPGFAGVSTAILAAAGQWLFLAGHCPTDENGEVVRGDFEAQVRAVFNNLQATLNAAGVGFEAVAKFNVYVTDCEAQTLATFKKVRNEYVNAQCPPASILLKVAGLYDPAIRIEIDGIALISPSKSVNAS